jgi:hypothetical protein
MPHLSLLYSDIIEDRKRAIIDSIGISPSLRVRFGAVELWAQDPGGIREWYRVARGTLPEGREDYCR